MSSAIIPDMHTLHTHYNRFYCSGNDQYHLSKPGTGNIHPFLPAQENRDSVIQSISLWLIERGSNMTGMYLSIISPYWKRAVLMDNIMFLLLFFVKVILSCKSSNLSRESVVPWWNMTQTKLKHQQTFYSLPCSNYPNIRRFVHFHYPTIRWEIFFYLPWRLFLFKQLLFKNACLIVSWCFGVTFKTFWSAHVLSAQTAGQWSDKATLSQDELNYSLQVTVICLMMHNRYRKYHSKLQL